MPGKPLIASQTSLEQALRGLRLQICDLDVLQCRAFEFVWVQLKIDPLDSLNR